MTSQGDTATFELRESNQLMTALALGIKGAFIILGFAGVAIMWEAVFGDMGVALLAILNSAKLVGISRNFGQTGTRIHGARKM